MEKSKLNKFFKYLLHMPGLWLVQILTNWIPDMPVTCRFRGFLCGLFFKKCGQNFQCGSHVRFLCPWGIEIGDNVYIAAGSWISGTESLVLKDEVVIGPYVIIATADHTFKDSSVRFGGSVRAPVEVGRGSWIASHVVVTPGVIIGKGCLIAAGAVVTKSIPDNVVAGGVPAKIIKECTDER